MPIFVPDEIVTAAKMNLIMKPTADEDTGAGRTFTNVGYLDLDALTGGSGTLAAVSVSVTTETTALVIFSGRVSNTGGVTVLAYRISGATTVASNDKVTVLTGGTTLVQASLVYFHEGLTAGTNVFELQARVTAGTGTLIDPKLTVIPI